MYSPRIIEQKLTTFRNRQGWEPFYHSIQQIKEFTAYIDSITKMESNSKNSYISLTRRLSEQRLREIKRWIENEQIICTVDFDYFSTRYAFICDEKGEIFQFKPRVSQEIFKAVVAQFEDLEVAIELLILKARQLGCCLDPETRVLTDDLRWMRLEDVHVGQGIVSVDENIPGGRGAGRKMRKATVVARHEVFEPSFKLTMDNGEILIATGLHRFLCKVRGNTATCWREVRHMKIGDEIRYITQPWNESSTYEDGWFSGMLDGEGSLRQKPNAGVEVCVSQVEGDVLERARDYLKTRGYTTRVEIDNRKGGESSKLGNKPVHKLVLGRMNEIFRLIGETRPARFIKRAWWDGKELPGKKIGEAWSKIVSIEPVGERRMIDLQTTTATFIAEGFVSHNSTYTALMFLHRLLFRPNTQAVMASVQSDKSELIGRILDICYKRCPWWLVPQVETTKNGLPASFSNGSWLSIQSGMQATGIAQGWTPTLVHLSELADVPNPKKTIEEGLLRATHPSRNMFQVHEGTGGGNTGWLADTWRTAKEDYPRGLSRFCPLFLSWPTATDLYPEPDWLRKFPIPEGWNPMEATRKHVRKAEFYIRSTPFLAKICGENYIMPRHQQWFWEFNYQAAVKTHTERVFLSQMPADDYDALTGKNDLVFDQEVIEVKSRERERKYKIYAIVGQQIDEGFEPDESQIDYEDERIIVEWTSHRDVHYSWTLIPLLPFDEASEPASFDKVLVFEPPMEGRQYIIGVDTADGLGHDDEDRAVCNVTSSAKGNYPDIQVAELSSVRINPPQMVGFAACLGAWYGKKCRDPRGAKFIIEQRMKPGDDCQLQLKLMGFTWQHRMIRYDKKNVKENEGHQEGWLSNAWSVPFMTHRFVDAIKNGWYKPNSPFMIRELGDYERKIAAGGKTKLEHQTGKHDDRIRAAAMAYISGHQLDVLQDRTTKVYSKKSGRLPEVDLSYAETNVMSVGE